MENNNEAVEKYAKFTVEKLSGEVDFKNYVPLTEVIGGKFTSSVEQQVYSWLDFDSKRLLVLLGDCGAGKTVLCKKICFELCNQLLKGDGKYIPIILNAEDALSEIVALNPLAVLKMLNAIFPDFSENFRVLSVSNYFGWV